MPLTLGSWNCVNWSSRASVPGSLPGPSTASCTSPKRPSVKVSVTVSVPATFTRMPSSASSVSSVATGSVSVAAVGSAPAAPTTCTLVTLVSSVSCVPVLVNSTTEPVTRTTSPTFTDVVLPPWKMNRPSEVAALPSASASSSCRKKPASPLLPWKSPTTTASTVTVWPASGDRAPLPWMAEIFVGAVSLSAMVMLALAVAPRSYAAPSVSVSMTVSLPSVSPSSTGMMLMSTVAAPAGMTTCPVSDGV